MITNNTLDEYLKKVQDASELYESFVYGEESEIIRRIVQDGFAENIPNQEGKLFVKITPSGSAFLRNGGYTGEVKTKRQPKSYNGAISL